MKIAELRSKRQMVAATFGWLSMPMHAALIGLLIFIVNVMGMFGEALHGVQLSDTGGASIPASLGTAGTFAPGDLTILNGLVMMIIVVLTAANAYAVHATTGGHGHKLFYHLGVMMGISGGALLVIPIMAQKIFSGVAAIPT